MCSNSEPQQLPPAMPHDHQAIEQPKRDRWSHKQSIAAIQSTASTTEFTTGTGSKNYLSKKMRLEPGKTPQCKKSSVFGIRMAYGIARFFAPFVKTILSGDKALCSDNKVLLKMPKKPADSARGLLSHQIKFFHRAPIQTVSSKSKVLSVHRTGARGQAIRLQRGHRSEAQTSAALQPL
jgi:hypothetical protein